MDLGPPSAVEQAALLEAGWSRIHGATERIEAHRRVNRDAGRHLIFLNTRGAEEDFRELAGDNTVGEPSSGSGPPSDADTDELNQWYELKAEENAETRALVTEARADEQVQGEAFETRRMESNDTRSMK